MRDYQQSGVSGVSDVGGSPVAHNVHRVELVALAFAVGIGIEGGFGSEFAQTRNQVIPDLISLFGVNYGVMVAGNEFYVLLYPFDAETVLGLRPFGRHRKQSKRNCNAHCGKGSDNQIQTCLFHNLRAGFFGLGSRLCKDIKKIPILAELHKYR